MRATETAETATAQTAGVAPVERLRGMHDVPPARLAAREATAGRMLAAFARAGYGRVDVPTIEPTELFLRQTGEERVGQMYAFRYRNRELTLRPEFTASVVRAALADPSTALPARLSYCGPVFRYERPGGTRSRQFTEIGAELLGAGGPAADAEAIGLAYDALRVAGVANPALVIGHVGVARGYLAGLRLDERVRDWLVWSMERLRPDDPDGERVHPALAALLAEETALPAAPAATIAPDRDTFLALLREAGIALDGGNRRSAEEIAEGVMRKIARRDERGDVRRALAFLRRLVTLRGAPDDVLPQLEALLADEGLGGEGAQRLRDVLAILPAYGVPTDAITLDMGLGRGLTYYTGLVFQLYAEGPEQLGGGGRYDDLAGVLGASEPWPAVGFSLGLEAILARATPEPPASEPPMVVVETNGDDAATAMLAARLRALGWAATLDLGGKRTGNATDAARATANDDGTVRWIAPDGATRHVSPDALPAPPTHETNEGRRDA